MVASQPLSRRRPCPAAMQHRALMRRLCKRPDPAPPIEQCAVPPTDRPLVFDDPASQSAGFSTCFMCASRCGTKVTLENIPQWHTRLVPAAYVANGRETRAASLMRARASAHRPLEQRRAVRGEEFLGRGAAPRDRRRDGIRRVAGARRARAAGGAEPPGADRVHAFDDGLRPPARGLQERDPRSRAALRRRRGRLEEPRCAAFCDKVVHCGGRHADQRVRRPET